jgi:hypothetical protein
MADASLTDIPVRYLVYDNTLSLLTEKHVTTNANLFYTNLTEPSQTLAMLLAGYLFFYIWD